LSASGPSCSQPIVANLGLKVKQVFRFLFFGKSVPQKWLSFQLIRLLGMASKNQAIYRVNRIKGNLKATSMTLKRKQSKGLFRAIKATFFKVMK